ncbi:MAG: type IV pilus biogenesis/stability protein PilW [Gammaproteobacteria bacterium]|nr:type IV pilus biogenesis/stability protein PilW [Gammaproteobacteria bacterium]MBT8443812.1 type IV pilus biogenesis/stability protein PilW [Gammaproteobacteria bacterium]NND37570.1 type IV pilus biogenesis/stability protein PilW [Gammaproteobacteria bacterium]
MVQSNRFVAIACVVLAMLLAGCVTETTSGRVQPKEQPEEAASLNVDLGVSYLRKGDLQSAQAKLEKAVELDPDNVTAHRALGLVYETLGDSKGAEKAYRKAVSLAPNDPEALNSLGVFLCRNDATVKEALGNFDRAIAIPQSRYFSNKAMLNSNAGVCAKNVDLALAENYLRAALNYDSQFPDALLQMADVAFQRENYLQSRAFLQRYAAVSKPTPEALWLSFQVETAMGDLKAADEHARSLRTDFPESVETRMLLERERNAG